MAPETGRDFFMTTEQKIIIALVPGPAVDHDP